MGRGQTAARERRTNVTHILLVKNGTIYGMGESIEDATYDAWNADMDPANCEAIAISGEDVERAELLLSQYGGAWPVPS